MSPIRSITPAFGPQHTAFQSPCLICEYYYVTVLYIHIPAGLFWLGYEMILAQQTETTIIMSSVTGLYLELRRFVAPSYPALVSGSPQSKRRP